VNVIIVYATKHGSTQGVAGAVADALRERGAQVTLRRARAVRTGRRIRLGRARRGAVLRPLAPRRYRFLKRHRRELAGVPVAVFGMAHAATPRMPGSAPVPGLTGRWASIAG